VSVDKGFSGGLLALQRAQESIKSGASDMAIVLSGNIAIINGATSLQLSALGGLSADGVSRCFDNDGKLFSFYFQSYINIVRDPVAELVYPSSVCSKPNFYAYIYYYILY